MPHVTPNSHIMCDLFSYWDADRNTFRFLGVRGEWTITLEDVHRILGLLVLGRKLTLEIVGSRSVMIQQATYMGDTIVSSGLKKGIKVWCIATTPIPTL